MRFEIGFGVGFDRNGKAITDWYVGHAVREILAYTARLFGGCNIVAGNGAWMDGDQLIIEQSRVLVVDVQAPCGGAKAHKALEDVRVLADFIGRTLNQKAVHVTQIIGIRSEDFEVKI